MSATNSSPNSAGGFSIGLSTARFLDASILDDGTAVPTVPADQPAKAASPSIQAAANESETSVTDYMHSLMQRCNGSSSQPGIRQEQQQLKDGSTVQAPPQVAKHELPLTSAEYVPQKQAPERRADMSSLRRLANDSTRVAISSFAERQYQNRRKANIAGTVCTLVAAVPLFVFSHGFGDPMSLAGVASLLASGVFGIRLYKFSLKKPDKTAGSVTA